MFRSIAVFALLLASIVSVPRQADAGALLIVSGIPVGVVSAAAAGGLVGAGFALAIPGTLISQGKTRAIQVAAVVLLILDQKTQSTQTEAALAERYSFIEDRSVIHALAEVFMAKAQDAPAVSGTQLIQISRSEILDVLAPSDLVENHAEEVEAMIAELE